MIYGVLRHQKAAKTLRVMVPIVGNNGRLFT